MLYQYVLKASYGNDSCALIQWAHEQGLRDVAVLYNDTGWAQRDWLARVEQKEAWVKSLGFVPHRTRSIGLEQLVKNKKSWPRQGMQFCTAELKIRPTEEWYTICDPLSLAVTLIGVRREESKNRATFPEFSVNNGHTIWAPLVNHSEMERDRLIANTGEFPLSYRSLECFPCINSNRENILQLAGDEERIAEIEAIETEMGFTAEGKPRTMFRPYRYMGATGIRQVVRWAKSKRGKFNLDDGNESSGCEAGWCGH